MSATSFDVLHVKGDVDLNSLRPRNAIILLGSPGAVGEVVTSQGPGKAPQWGAGGGGGGAVSSVFGRTGAVTAHSGDYTASQVGAISTSAEGAASGVATLDGTGNVPLSQLGNVPSGSSGNVPIGGVIWSPFVISDPNWLLLNGSTFSAATYPALYTANGNSNVLPDWRDVSPMGAHTTVALGATSGALTHSLTTAQLAAHTHTGDAHNHTMSHNHSHDHGPAGGAGGFIINSGTGGVTANPAGSFWPGERTDTDATGSSASNTGGSSIGTTGGTGSGSAFSILSPVVGANPYVRAS